MTWKTRFDEENATKNLIQKVHKACQGLGVSLACFAWRAGGKVRIKKIRMDIMI